MIADMNGRLGERAEVVEFWTLSVADQSLFGRRRGASDAALLGFALLLKLFPGSEGSRTAEPISVRPLLSMLRLKSVLTRRCWLRSTCRAHNHQPNRISNLDRGTGGASPEDWPTP